ncbi:hypothetical protein PV332_40230 [Streptomyces scabiei]|nr:hypothetical protein [Streptomyces scabiei]MDX2581661.1 hypothetical protein [Streptomyces scabiei]MDX2659038.1 hypothetical protein [Streptomyces scabiei]MDX2726938.1 hypothetical protein [Streptomyces scabiei]MDX2871933.1 hypothetical protein [Streptomyces scabiei]MDX2889658.1 hypothetical protein [Streptomyces scabiei]
MLFPDAGDRLGSRRVRNRGGQELQHGRGSVREALAHALLLPEQGLHLVEPTVGIRHVAPERAAGHVRHHGPRQFRPPCQSLEQLVDRLRPHRRTDHAAEEVHQQEVAAVGAQELEVLVDVLVECLHYQEVHRLDPRGA